MTFIFSFGLAVVFYFMSPIVTQDLGSMYYYLISLDFVPIYIWGSVILIKI